MHDFSVATVTMHLGMHLGVAHPFVCRRCGFRIAMSNDPRLITSDRDFRVADFPDCDGVMEARSTHCFYPKGSSWIYNTAILNTEDCERTIIHRDYKCKRCGILAVATKVKDYVLGFSMFDDGMIGRSCSSIQKLNTMKKVLG